jgi:hypothetical protein
MESPGQAAREPQEQSATDGLAPLRRVGLLVVALVALDAGILPLLEGSAEPSLATAGPWGWLSGLPTLVGGVQPAWSIGLALAALVGLAGAYVAAIRLARTLAPSRGTLLAILLVSGLASLSVVVSPPIRQADLFYYAFQGRMLARDHQNPYLVPPSALTADAWFPLVSPAWRNLTTGYGPTWLLVDAGVDLAVDTGGSLPDIVRTVLADRVLFAGLNLGNCLLLWLILGRLAPARQVTGTLAYAWNPAVLLVAPEHNDTLMLGLTLLGIWLALDRQSSLAAGSLTLATLVKYFPAPLLLGYLVWRWHSSDEPTPRRALPILIAVGVTGLFLAPFDPPAVLAQVPAYLAASGRAARVASVPFELSFVLVVLVAWRISRLSSQRPLVDVLSTGLLALFVYLAVFSRDWFPWYLVTALGVSALLGGAWLAAAAVAGVAWLLDLHQGLTYLTGLARAAWALPADRTTAIALFAPVALGALIAAFSPPRYRAIAEIACLVGLFGLLGAFEAPLVTAQVNLPAQLDDAVVNPAGPLVFGQTLAWEDWSWSAITQQVGTPTGPDGQRSLCITYQAPGGAFYAHQSGLSTARYQTVTFDLGPANAALPSLDLSLRGANGGTIGATALDSYVTNAPRIDGWRVVHVPLAALNARNATLTGLVLQDGGNAKGQTVCLQDLRFQ